MFPSTLYLAVAITFASGGAAARDLTNYSNVKAALTQRVRSTSAASDLSNIDRRTYLTQCRMAGDVIGFSGPDLDRTTQSLIALAFEIVELEYILQKSRYPEGLWRQELLNFESKTLNALRTNPSAEIDTDGFQDILVKKLNDYRRAQKTSALYPVEGGPGCGDGEVTVVISTDPPAQRIQFISTFYLDLCKRDNKENTDESSCDYWSDYSKANKDTGNQGAMLSGRYLIKVTWNRSSTEFRTLDVDTLKSKDNISHFSIKRRGPE